MAVTVIENWYLNDDASKNAIEVLKAMDDQLEVNAHAHPGWSGHATFLQDMDDPRLVMWMYKWGSRELHRDLMRLERSTVETLQRQFCTRPRTVRYVEVLPVEVDDH